MTVAIAGLAGCATVPEMGRDGFIAEGAEEEVLCSGACEEEWRRAEQWVKKYSGYAFPAEVSVTTDRISAVRVPFSSCVSVPQTQHQFLAPCSRPPLASEPIGFGENERTGTVGVGTFVADGGPHWTFLVVREAQEAGVSRIRLAQRCWSRSSRACSVVLGLGGYRQDAFRRFVRTGEPSLR